MCMPLFYGHMDIHPLDGGGYIVVRVRDATRPDEPLAEVVETVVQFTCHCDNVHDWLYHGIVELVTRLETDPMVMTFDDAPEQF